MPSENIVFTREQKIVVAVWYHERKYTGLTLEQLLINFYIRFQTNFVPNIQTIREWEEALFGKIKCNKKSMEPKTKICGRLDYIPYIKKSFKKYPNLSCRSRANLVGISSETLSYVLVNDFSTEDWEEINKYTSYKIVFTNEENLDESFSSIEMVSDQSEDSD